MSSTIYTYELNGESDFRVTFEYLREKFVYVTLRGVSTSKSLMLNRDFYFVDKGLIRTSKVWSNKDGFNKIEIRRVTPADERLIEYTDGSVLTSSFMNISYVQALHIAEESRDLASYLLGLTTSGDLDARGRRIINLPVPIDNNDAATKGYVDSTIGLAEGFAARAEKGAKDAEYYATLIRPDIAESVINVDTIAKLKTLNLREGDVIHVLGYSRKTDGGLHYRIITRERNASSESLNNGLYANILPTSFAVNLLSFGCDPTGSTDSFENITKCVEFCRINKLQLYSNGGTFKIEGGNIDMRGVAVACNSDFLIEGSNNYVILGGTALSGHDPSQFMRAFRTQRSARSLNPVVKVIGAKGQYMRVEYASSIMIFASDESDPKEGSSAYSTFDFDYVPYITIDSRGGGWINENTFNLKRCFKFEITSNGDYNHNNNIINGGTFEGVGKHIILNKGRNNIFNNIRLEGYQPDSIFFGEGTYMNNINLSWVSSESAELVFMGEYKDLGTSNTISSVTQGNYAIEPLLLLNRETLDFDTYNGNATWCSVKGVGDFKSDADNAPVVGGKLNVQPESNAKLKVISFNLIARTPKVPISPTDSWLIINSYGWGKSSEGMRYILHGYDKEGRLLPATGKDVYVHGSGMFGFGNVGASANTQNAYIKIKNKDCYYIKFIIRNGNGDSTFENISVTLRTGKDVRKVNTGLYVPKCVPFNLPNIKQGVS